MALVLCTGVDPILLETRRLLLERAGHAVTTIRDERELTAACQKTHFEVAVIGQGVTPKMKRVIASRIREHCPSARILELYSPHQGKSLDDADSWMEVPADLPGQLAQRVSELAAQDWHDEASA